MVYRCHCSSRSVELRGQGYWPCLAYSTLNQRDAPTGIQRAGQIGKDGQSIHTTKGPEHLAFSPKAGRPARSSSDAVEAIDELPSYDAFEPAPDDF
jgi:hypothetical protein